MLLEDLHERGVVEGNPVLQQDELAVEIGEGAAGATMALDAKLGAARAVVVEHAVELLLELGLPHDKVLLGVDEEPVELLELGVERLDESALLVGELSATTGGRGFIRRLIKRFGDALQTFF